VVRRFPISFDPWYAFLSTIMLIPTTRAHVTVGADLVDVHMGWAFHASLQRSAIVRTTRDDEWRPVSRGAHGWRNRWLVNGKGTPLVHLDLDPPQRGSVLGFPLRLRRVTVSTDTPDDLVEALGG
jgi:hypothetical protein